MGVGQGMWPLVSPLVECMHATRGGTHLLLPTFIASTLDRLSSLIIARVIIVHILYTSWRAVHARNGHIAFATLHVGSGHGDRCMINPRHYGTYDD